MTYISVYSHPVLGKITLASDGTSLVGLWLEGQKYFGRGAELPWEQSDDLPVLVQAREWLDRYFAGKALPISKLPLAPRGTEFQRRVWKALADIPYGQLRSYKDIAMQLAREQGKGQGSARAAGSAVGRNPISIILPCHRVIGSDGSLTGYAAGLERKIWLLAHEQVDVSKLRMPTRGSAL